MNVMIKVKAEAVATDVTHVVVRFRNPGGSEFGYPIELKLKVEQPVQTIQQVKQVQQVQPVQLSQVELTKLAVKLFTVTKLGQSFDEVLAVVNQFNGDE